MTKSGFKQWLSIHIEKNPSRVILLSIILMNIVFFLLSAFIISKLAPDTLAARGFWPSVFYTITMILDAGCIQFVVENVGQTGVAVIIICIAIVLIGMITFTGCVVGYITNFISDFIAHANTGSRKLHITDHIVILNWNNRAAEIINDLLYSEHHENVVVLVEKNKENVEKEIADRLSDTIEQEDEKYIKEAAAKNILERFTYRLYHRFRNNVTVIVRQGDVFSAKQLMDIAVDKAKTIIILNSDGYDAAACKYVPEDEADKAGKGSPLTIKTLVLVAEITAAETSADNQKIIVEVCDNWTSELVDKIISHKESLGKCNIIPLPVNNILGQLLSQFSIMPQLNLVYNELFSNKGAEFYAAPADAELDVKAYLREHCHAVPLTSMDTKTGLNNFYMADLSGDIESKSLPEETTYKVDWNFDYWQPQRNILILGHNSRIESLMSAFDSYRSEWNMPGVKDDILNITVVDDAKSLKKKDYYRQYPYVTNVIEAEIYDRDIIYAAINEFIQNQNSDNGILILSDDAIASDELDSNVLTYLIYVHDVLTSRTKDKNILNPGNWRTDVVIEILNPKNNDVVRSYSVNNVVMSNRYISKLITQIGEKDALYEFYKDILAYDESNATEYDSKELYIKQADKIFLDIPDPCTASELIRAVYAASTEHNDGNFTIVLGYISNSGEMHIFSGDQRNIKINLQPEDRLIIFSNH